VHGANSWDFNSGTMYLNNLLSSLRILKLKTVKEEESANLEKGNLLLVGKAEDNSWTVAFVLCP
jgi:hypothetical protein